MDMAKSFFGEMCKDEFFHPGDALSISSSVKNKNIDVKMSILHADKLNLEHICVALNIQEIKLTTISFFWKDYSEKVLKFLLALNIQNIEILDYKEIDGKSPRAFLKLQSLVSVNFFTNMAVSLPKKFLLEVRKKNIVVILNDKIVNWGQIDDSSLPLNLRLEYLMSQRLHYVNSSSLEEILSISDNKLKDENDEE